MGLLHYYQNLSNFSIKKFDFYKKKYIIIKNLSGYHKYHARKEQQY